jgi:hypothetical protein
MTECMRCREYEEFLSEDIAPFKDVEGMSWRQTLPDGTEIPVLRGCPDLSAFIVRLHLLGAEITAERDELLEALEAMVDTWDAYLSSAKGYPSYQKAKAAIAKAKGGKP